MADYADFVFEDRKPGYAFKRYLGEAVTNTMGDRDSKWISEHVMEVEVPDMLKTLEKGLKDLFDTANTDTPPGSSAQPG